MVLVQSKKCSRCRVPKLLDEFGRNRSERDGHQHYCKPCQSAANRETYQRTRDQRRKDQAAYYAKTREARLEAMRVYGREHRVLLGQEERDRVNAAQRANPEAHRDRQARRRARKRGSHAESVNALVVLELHDGVCGICDEDVDPLNFHVDHRVPLALGGEHTYENTQPAHPACNLRKGWSA